jgi:pilus assembly protein CpaF
MAFEHEPLGPDRIVRGRFNYYAVPEELAQRIVLAGQQIPPQIRVASGGEFAPERQAL